MTQQPNDITYERILSEAKAIKRGTGLKLPHAQRLAAQQHGFSSLEDARVKLTGSAQSGKRLPAVAAPRASAPLALAKNGRFFPETPPCERIFYHESFGARQPSGLSRLEPFLSLHWDAFQMLLDRYAIPGEAPNEDALRLFAHGEAHARLQADAVCTVLHVEYPARHAAFVRQLSGARKRECADWFLNGLKFHAADDLRCEFLPRDDLEHAVFWLTLRLPEETERLFMSPADLRETLPALDEALACARTIDGKKVCNLPRHRGRMNAALDDIEWGYGGVGPRNLALNVLDRLLPVGRGGPAVRPYGDVVVSEQAFSLCQAFKRTFVETMDPAGGAIPMPVIQAWIDRQLSGKGDDGQPKQ